MPSHQTSAPAQLTPPNLKKSIPYNNKDCTRARGPKTLLDHILIPNMVLKNIRKRTILTPTQTSHPNPYATHPTKVDITKSIQARNIWAPTQIRPLNLMKPKSISTSKTENIHSNFSFNKITNFEGVVNYKIIRKIQRKIKANMSSIQSELGGGYNVLDRIQDSMWNKSSVWLD